MNTDTLSPLLESLTTVEKDRLAELESLIQTGFTTFVEVGSALLEIRNFRLYRSTHTSFDAYLCEKWDMTRQRASQLIQAAGIAQELSTMVDTSSLISERQAREFANIRDPVERQEVYQESLLTAPGGKLTAKHVQQVKERRANDRALAKENGQTPLATTQSHLTVISDIIQRLQERLQTKVEVHHGNKQGLVIIHYYGDADLTRLIELMERTK